MELKDYTTEELKAIIGNRIAKDGPDCNLNDIDTSLITDMSYLFYDSKFNGNISDWDVSKVKYTVWMFAYSSFNQDISEWDLSICESMGGMFLIK